MCVNQYIDRHTHNYINSIITTVNTIAIRRREPNEGGSDQFLHQGNREH